MTDVGPALRDAVPAGHDDRDRALAWAAMVRAGRVALRDDMQAGRRSLDDVLAERATGPDGRVKVLFVLESLPGAGKVRTRRRLAQLGVTETTPLGALTDDVCADLIAAFPLGDPGADGAVGAVGAGR